MFCYQCEQTAHGTGCVTKGTCGKLPATAAAQDELTYELMRLGAAMAASGAEPTTEQIVLIMEGLFTTVTNVSFGAENSSQLAARAQAARLAIGGAGAAAGLALEAVSGPEDIFGQDGVEGSCRSLIVLGLRGMAAYAHHAYVLGYRDARVEAALVRHLAAAGRHHTVEEWLGLVHDFGMDNFVCMALLDKANTETYGTPVPTTVPLTVEKGPFIVVTGHDLKDLKLLLEQTAGKGVNIYTHGEMLPAHAYPELKKYPQLKGNFGTAWQNQQKEFDGIPAPILYTTNCLMPPRASYKDRVFTTDVVSFPDVVHIGEDKDFTPVIEKALELGGYDEDKAFTGINGGAQVTTGFGHGTVLSVADKVVEAVKAGQISHFFLVAGCDGAKPGRNYYTEFVKQTPADSVVLTLACGKYRFNDLDLGTVAGLPRIMDMGQCNDAYSAIQVAVALAGAFNCGVNDLPLSFVLSWYEQKAVCILLTLLHLGIKNIYLGPSLPAFVSADVLDVLVEQFGIRPISTPDADLAAMAG
jgi:hydroxylamine reductase